MKESKPWDGCSGYKNGKCPNNDCEINTNKLCCYKCPVRCNEACGYFNNDISSR